MDGRDEIFKRKKGSRILTHNGTKKTATNLFVLFSEEWNKKETTIPLQEQKKKIIISVISVCLRYKRRFDKTWRHEDHLENNDYDENHGSEAPDDDSDDKRHGWRHTWQVYNIGSVFSVIFFIFEEPQCLFLFCHCNWWMKRDMVGDIPGTPLTSQSESVFSVCFLAAHGVSSFVLSKS